MYIYIYLECRSVASCITRDVFAQASTSFAANFSPMSNPFTPELDEYVRSRISNLRDKQNVGKWEQILKKFEEAGLVTTMDLLPEWVYVHPLNRNKVGINPGQMNSHGGGIVRQGFSWSRSSDALALAPRPEETEYIEQSNVRLNEMSGGLLPPLSLLKAIGIGGNNTNAFLRALRAKSKCVLSEYADENGNWDTPMLVQRDPPLAEATERGLKWKVLDSRVAVRYSGLVEFIINALNTRTTAEISEVEGMLAVHASAMADIAAGNPPDWKKGGEVIHT